MNELKGADHEQVIRDSNTELINELHRTIHDLHTHQVELENQNEELRRVQIELLDARNRYSELYDLSPVGYLTINTKGTILDANLTFASLVKTERHEIRGGLLSDFIHRDCQDVWYLFLKDIIRTTEHQVCEVRVLTKVEAEPEKNVYFWARLDGRPILGQAREISQVHITFNDISEQRRAQEQLHYQAFYDTITGLPNRRLFINRFGQYLSHVKRTEHHGALIYIDIDNFKFINDSYGHAIGDEVLKNVGLAIGEVIRKDDSAARIGGDEFVVLLTELSVDSESAAMDALKVASEINKNISHSQLLEDLELNIETSVGVTTFPNHVDSIEEIMSCADIAMYQAKNSGKNGIQFFEKDMYDRAKKKMELYKRLQRAFVEKEFNLFYQPIVDDTKKVLGAECLLRWDHPAKMGLMTADFISVLEDSCLIFDVGSWVISAACEQLVAWQRQGQSLSELILTVNISPKQFKQPKFVEMVKSIIDRAGANAAQLVFEITESMLLSDTKATINKMRELKALGITFAIDDFGTGYSSLCYLKNLPIDIIKIDQTFVRNIYANKENIALVKAIFSIAEHLNLNVIAEGVEEEDEFLALRKGGCSLYQGFLFSRPLSQDAFARYIVDMS